MGSATGRPGGFQRPAEDHQSLGLEEVKARLGSEREGHFVVGAFENGRLAMAGFDREKGLKSRHKGCVWGVYMTPGKRRERVGRSILQTLLEHGAKLEGMEQILLSAAATETAAIGWYRSLGFQSFGCEPRALRIGDRFIDEEYLVMRVKHPHLR